MTYDKLTFERFRIVNVARCEDVFHSLDDWGLTAWACAAAGEMGEACNVVKKELRGDYTQITVEQFRGMLADELADVITYVDLLAARAGIDLGKALCSKFNRISKKKGSKWKL